MIVTAIKWLAGGVISIVGLFVLIVIIKVIFFLAIYGVLALAASNMQ